MPMPIKSDRRKIAKTEDNMDVLQAWEDSEVSILSEEERTKVLDSANIIKLKGNIAYIRRWFEDHEIHVKDAGQIVVIKEEKFELDYRAYNHYRNFEHFLNSVAIKMGLDATIDADLLDQKKALQETYALNKYFYSLH